MNKHGIFGALVALVLVALLTMTLLMGSVSASAPQAGPQAVVTPAGQAQSVAGKLLPFLNGAVITTGTATCSAEQNIINNAVADVQYVIDQGTTNTVTLKLRFSNDGTNWVDGDTLVTNNAADANVMLRYTMLGRYACVQYDATNTNPLTITVIGVGR